MAGTARKISTVVKVFTHGTLAQVVRSFADAQGYLTDDVCAILPNMTMTIPTETIGERMRRARRARGMTARRMAAELRISQPSVSRYELGDETPKRSVILAYAYLCNVPAEWIETGQATVTPGYPAGLLAA